MGDVTFFRQDNGFGDNITAFTPQEKLKSQTLLKRDRYRIDHLRLCPGERLPLMTHVHSRKIWVLVEGSAVVELAGQTTTYYEGQIIQMNIGQQHTICNPGKIDLSLVEVRIGTYLQDDDLLKIAG